MKDKKLNLLLLDAENIICKIDQMFLDCEHWNNIHPNEEDLNPDPDGSIIRLRNSLETFINGIERQKSRNVKND